MERTLVLLKPDAVQRGLIGAILARFEAKGLKLVALEMRTYSVAHMQRHYEVHEARPFFANLVEFMTSGPVVALALEGKQAIDVVRGMMGATDSGKAAPGTIRGDYGLSFSRNLVNGSDSAESAEKELALFFPDAARVSEWTPVTEEWVYSVAEELKRD